VQGAYQYRAGGRKGKEIPAVLKMPAAPGVPEAADAWSAMIDGPAEAGPVAS